MFYIVCKRHLHKKDHAILFWGPARVGYTFNINSAGLYSEEDIRIFDSPEDDAPVSEDIVRSCSVVSVIDNRTLGKICLNNTENRRAMSIKLCQLLDLPTAWNSRAFCDPATFLSRNEHAVKLLDEIAGLHK